MWSVIGWIVWALVTCFALTFAHGCRKYTSAGQGFQSATGVQTLFWWLISVVFLVAPFNKLHIIWLIPVAFFSAQFIALGRIPIVSPAVLLVTRMFLSAILLDVRENREAGSPVDKNALIKELVRRRLRSDPLANLISHSSHGEGFDDMLESLSVFQLAGLPEGTVVTIVETWAMLRRASTTDAEIFARIEAYRSQFFPQGKLPTPLNLMSYVKYRLAIEHAQGTPGAPGAKMTEAFVESAVEAAKEAYGA